MWKVVSSVADFWGDINPATLSGAIDIVVVRGVDGSLSCSPFHVRFGKLVLLRPTEKKVEIAVNGVQVDIPMKVGEAGEAFFVVEMDDERDPAPSEYATSPIIKGALAFSEGPVEALELGDTSVSKEGEGDLDENDTSIKKDTFDDENEAQVPVKSILLNDAPLDNHIAELDSTQEGMDMSSRYIPVGSPGWQWNWGGLPKKKEGVSENPGDNDAHLGTSAVKEGVTIASSIHANAGSSSMSVTAGTDFGLNEKVPIPTKPPVTSSLTAALQKEGVSPTSTGIIPESAVIDVDQPSVTVDEKVDNYLSSFPDLMAAPDKPPSLRATSPSPMMHAETQIEMATAPLVSFPSDLSDSSHQLELSLCGNNAIASALYSQGPTTAAASAAEIFKKYEVTFDSFIANPAMLSTNQNLVLRLNGSYYDWSVVAPVLVAAVAFGKSFPEEELRRLILSSSLNDKAIIASVGASGSGGGSEEPRRYSSFGNLRSWWSRPTATTNSASPAPGTSPQPQTSPAPGVVPLQPTASGLSAVAEALTANDLAGSLAPSVDGAASGSVDDDRAVSHRYIKSLRMTSDQLKGLNLNKGVNTISFTVTSRLQGTATCTSKIFLWEHDTRVVISDVDGTITKSDVLGHVFTMVGQDWTHSGVASLYTNIRKNDYQILYLTSRAIGQANYTRDYLKKVDQDKFKLPEGPVVMSPDRLFTAFHREVIQRRPEEFKIACLRDIQRLFGPNARPFYAGFGNRITDVQSYRAVQVPLSRIFTIDPSGEIKLEFTKDYKSSYVKLNEIVDRIFPPVSENVEVGDGVDVEGNDWNMWKQYLPEAVANMNAEAKKESGGDMDVPDESSAVANVNEPSATVPSESNIVTVSKGKEATLVVESTANESGAVEIEYEDYEDGESEEYDEDEEADEGTALDNTTVNEDDEKLRMRMAEMKKYKF